MSWEKAKSLVMQAGLWKAVIILGLIALVLFGFGLRIQNTLLQNAGWGIGGAVLALAITIITSREAVKQQNAKEANITRKNDLYFPVFTDLKSIQDRWTSAEEKQSPYPRYVRGVGNESQEPGGYPLNYPAFTSWPSFKAGPRKSDFTGRAASLLDKVQ